MLATAASLPFGQAFARDLTIQVWAGGSNVADAYRVDAITMAADILEREAEIRGEELNITVETKYDFDGWGGFKQAVILAAEANNAPHIVVTGHGDIAPWSQSGLIRPIEDYVDFDSWPLNDLFENLIEISSYGLFKTASELGEIEEIYTELELQWMKEKSVTLFN